MITEIQGDVFESDAPVFLHGCNCMGVMGAGVAKTVANRWPTVLNQYQEHCRLERPETLLGTYHVVPTPKWFVVNAFTQLYVGGGKQVSYDAIDRIMSTLNYKLPKSKIEPRVAMPRIGAGLAGGNWEIIRTIIEENTPNLNVEVYFL